MRGTIFLGAFAVLAAAIWFAWPREQALPEAAAAGADEPRPEAVLESQDEVAAPLAEPQRSSVAALRFEPLPGDPTELVLRFITGDPERELTGVEAWALEMDEYEGYQGHIADVERELRERGRKLECDASGRAHLPLPARWLLVGARQGELFGAHSFEADDAPEDALELVDSHPCTVHTRSSAGRAYAGVPVIVTQGRGVVWQGTSDGAGELVIPNLGWLLEDFGRGDSMWFVSVAEGAPEPALARFETGAPVPRTVDLVLGPASSLRLRILASDGTPVPINGEVSYDAWGPEARLSSIRLGNRSTMPLPIRAGVALIPRAQAGARLDLYALLDGGQVVSADLFVPEGLGEHEVQMRLQPEQQVLRFRVNDAQGSALGGRKVEWFTYDGRPGADPETNLEPLQLDEQGCCALVIERYEHPPPDPEDETEPEPLPKMRGVLRLREAGVLLESPTLRLDELGTAPVIDVGVLRLEPAQPLVRGRVHDATGKGIARVSITLERVLVTEGQEDTEEMRERLPLLTDAEGRFELFGTCPSGRVRVQVDRTGYVLPEGVRAPEFECGGTETVDITLVRTGVLRMSILTDAPLRETCIWMIDGPDGEERVLRQPSEERGELTDERWWMTPGRYRVRLVSGYPFDRPFLDVDGVEVRAGETTLDPRILRVRVQEPPAQPSAPSSGPEKVELRIVDESGRPLRDGTFTTWGYDNWSVGYFHAGAVVMRADQIGRQVGLWAPGRRYREIDCPDHDETIALQPAPRMRLRLDVPPEFGRAGVRLLASLHGEECELRNVPDVWSGVDVDARGEAVFDCPVPCTFRLELVALRVDAAGLMDDGTSLETDEALEFTLADQPGEQLWKPAIRAEEWAALAQALGLK